MPRTKVKDEALALVWSLTPLWCLRFGHREWWRWASPHGCLDGSYKRYHGSSSSTWDHGEDDQWGRLLPDTRLLISAFLPSRTEKSLSRWFTDDQCLKMRNQRWRTHKSTTGIWTASNACNSENRNQEQSAPAPLGSPYPPALRFSFCKTLGRPHLCSWVSWVLKSLY